VNEKFAKSRACTRYIERDFQERVALPPTPTNRFSGAGGVPTHPYKSIFQGRVGAPPAHGNLFQFDTKNLINSKKIAKYIQKVKILP
jgi:hypothetical protein